MWPTGLAPFKILLFIVILNYFVGNSPIDSVMRFFSTVFFSILYFAATAQTENRIYTFKQIGWTIQLPADFDVMDSIDNIAHMEKGLKAIEDATDVTADISKTITLISATKDKFNYFNATIEPFDDSDGLSWESSNQTLKEVLYATFAEKMSDAAIDTISGKQIIDGVSFDRYHITISLDGKPIFNMLLLSKLYKGFDFGISYLYLDERTRLQIESMLEQSKFSK